MNAMTKEQVHKGAAVAALLTALLLITQCQSATAGEAEVSWTAPTTNIDNSPIPASGPEALAGYRVQSGTCNGAAFGALSTEVTVGAGVRLYRFENLAPQVWCFRVLARNNANAESDWSNVSTKTVLPGRPSPPVLSVTNTTVYTIIKQVDRFVMMPVGTVPADTPCVADQNINGYYVVARASVTWAGNVRPDVVVARCT